MGKKHPTPELAVDGESRSGDVDVLDGEICVEDEVQQLHLQIGTIFPFEKAEFGALNRNSCLSLVRARVRLSLSLFHLERKFEL